MKHRSLSFALVVLLGCLATARAASGPTVESAWARAPIGAAGAMALYLTIHGGSAPDRLVGVDSPVAGMAMLHKSVEQGGVSSMDMLDAIDIPAGATVALRPGGMHVMLEDLRSRPAPGQSIEITLHFQQAGDEHVTVPVRPAGAAAP
jgi:copper(I)-binding protein